MISIKKFLSKDNETERALLDAVRMLIQGIGEIGMTGPAEETRRSRETIQEISDALSKELAPEDLATHARSVLSELEDNNRRALRRQNLQTVELQNMVKMLTSTVGIVSAAGNTNVQRLSEIEKQVTVASALDDVRLIKSKLSDCLADIREDAERQKKETGETIEELNKSLEHARSGGASVVKTGPLDAVTGLLTRPGAEEAFARATRDGTQVYAAVLVLDRLQTVNLRFGREVGDEVLVAFAAMIRGLLSAGDTLFRWSGPTLVALLPRQNSLERVRSEIARIAETKLEHIIETPERSILLPFSARWVVLPMTATPRLLHQQIDSFASPTPQE